MSRVEIMSGAERRRRRSEERLEPVNTSSRRISGLFFEVRKSHSVLSREPLFNPFDQASVASSLGTSTWRTLRRQAEVCVGTAFILPDCLEEVGNASVARSVGRD